jgi:hypothetical protein
MRFRRRLAGVPQRLKPPNRVWVIATAEAVAYRSVVCRGELECRGLAFCGLPGRVGVPWPTVLWSAGESWSAVA